MLLSIFSREARRCVRHAFQGVASIALRLGGKAPLPRGAASPDVLDSIWKAKLCFPGTPFPVGLQSFSQMPLGRAMHWSQAVEVFLCRLWLLEEHLTWAGTAVRCTAPGTDPPLDWWGRNVLSAVKAVPVQMWWPRSRRLRWWCVGEGLKGIAW